MVARGSWPYEFHPEAEAELLAAGQWYADRDEAVAVRLYEALKHCVALVCESPERWPKYLLGTRKIPLRGFPYLIIYRTLADRVQIVAFAHGRRRPGYWRRRV